MLNSGLPYFFALAKKRSFCYRCVPLRIPQLKLPLKNSLMTSKNFSKPSILRYNRLPDVKQNIKLLFMVHLPRRLITILT